MAAPLETCTREEQSYVIRFLRSEGVKPIETYQKNFFLDEFMHFLSAGGLALSVGEIMLKSDTALYHFCTINTI